MLKQVSSSTHLVLEGAVGGLCLLFTLNTLMTYANDPRGRGPTSMGAPTRLFAKLPIFSLRKRCPGGRVVLRSVTSMECIILRANSDSLINVHAVLVASDLVIAMGGGDSIVFFSGSKGRLRSFGRANVDKRRCKSIIDNCYVSRGGQRVFVCSKLRDEVRICSCNNTCEHALGLPRGHVFTSSVFRCSRGFLFNRSCHLISSRSKGCPIGGAPCCGVSGGGKGLASVPVAIGREVESKLSCAMKSNTFNCMDLLVSPITHLNSSVLVTSCSLSATCMCHSSRLVPLAIHQGRADRGGVPVLTAISIVANHCLL